MYYFNFSAYFVCGKFNAALLQAVIPTVVGIFNSLPRKQGTRMRIDVSINTSNECLDITLGTEKMCQPRNCLRRMQYFSKILAKQPGMRNYVINGELLRS